MTYLYETAAREAAVRFRSQKNRSPRNRLSLTRVKRLGQSLKAGFLSKEQNIDFVTVVNIILLENWTDIEATKLIQRQDFKTYLTVRVGGCRRDARPWRHTAASIVLNGPIAAYFDAKFHLDEAGVISGDAPDLEAELDWKS